VPALEAIRLQRVGIGSLRTGIFNLADATLMLGVMLLLFGRGRRRP